MNSHRKVTLLSLLSVGTIIGCVMLPLLAERVGRRATMGIYFALMAIFIVIGFGYVYYLTANALLWFFVCLFFLGLGGAKRGGSGSTWRLDPSRLEISSVQSFGPRPRAAPHTDRITTSVSVTVK